MKARFGQFHCFSYKIKITFSMFFVQKTRKLGFWSERFFLSFCSEDKKRDARWTFGRTTFQTVSSHNSKLHWNSNFLKHSLWSIIYDIFPNRKLSSFGQNIGEIDNWKRLFNSSFFCQNAWLMAKIFLSFKDGNSAKELCDFRNQSRLFRIFRSTICRTRFDRNVT